MIRYKWFQSHKKPLIFVYIPLLIRRCYIGGEKKKERKQIMLEYVLGPHFKLARELAQQLWSHFEGYLQSVTHQPIHSYKSHNERTIDLGLYH